jgi:hypothetical protein
LLQPSLRFLARQTMRSMADGAVTSPLVRWNWTGPGNEEFISSLP